MNKVELLLPAGNMHCLQAAVTNGADAVYLGLSRFNARSGAVNFDQDDLASAVSFCHVRKVKVYVTLNTLVKNHEIDYYFHQMRVAHDAGADAVIIQDPCFIPIIRTNFPGMEIHLSTQATVTNSASVPNNIDRVILARELTIDEIGIIARHHPTEVFIHGALCFSYSGQCLFSSIIGGRSGNRGRCAQPCRKKYNNKYNMSTMDLCLLPKLPEIISAGVLSLKVEGRLRSPIYVGTVARIYRKYIDLYYQDPDAFSVAEEDMDHLKVAFSREFTPGFGFTDSIIDNRRPTNRGLYIGQMKQGKLTLEKPLKQGDGVGIWLEKDIEGFSIKDMKLDDRPVRNAGAGDTVTFSSPPAIREQSSLPVYKTSSIDLKIEPEVPIPWVPARVKTDPLEIPSFPAHADGSLDHRAPRLLVKTYNLNGVLEADKAKADIIYYDIFRDDFAEAMASVKHARLFAFTPRILSHDAMAQVKDRLAEVGVDGVLVGNRGLLKSQTNREIHIDQSFNCFNDIDINCYPGTPIISPELSLSEMLNLKHRKCIVQVHGNMVLMTTKQPIKAPELIDEAGWHFKVRKYHDNYEILNSQQLGLFTRVMELVSAGFTDLYMDLSNDVGRFVRIYRMILRTPDFDDRKIRKGFTTGQFDRGVS